MASWFSKRIVERDGRFLCVSESVVYGCIPFWFSDWHETREAAEAEFFGPCGPLARLS